MAKRAQSIIASVVVLIAVSATPAHAWDVEGHQRVTRAALALLPPEGPVFLRPHSRAIAHHAVEPDVLASEAAGMARDRERPEHWLDVELLDGAPLPKTRLAYQQLLVARGVSERHAGAVLYALLEEVDALAVAFAEHRRFPRDPQVMAKVVTRAGRVSHLAADLVQPLHTTVHHDGRLREGRSPHSGIHRLVDALIGRLPHDDMKASGRPVRAAEPIALATAELMKAHALVDRVYELEPQLEPEGALSTSVRELAAERAGAATRLTATLWLVAWERSASVDLPSWVIALREREARERAMGAASREEHEGSAPRSLKPSQPRREQP